MIKRSVECPQTFYFDVFGLRLIFFEGKYAGWYKPGRKEK